MRLAGLFRSRFPGLTFVALLVVVVIFALFASSVFAATITVTNTNDSGAGSLRQAIIDANSGDTIVFGPGVTGTITLTSGRMQIDKDLAILGPLNVIGLPFLRLDANGASGFFEITPDNFVIITSLTLVDGSEANGGAILNAGTLELSGMELSDNVATVGGAIANTGTLTVENVVVSGNIATNGGGIYNDGTLTVTDSVFTANSADTGGGIDNDGTLTLTNVELNGNAADVGGGIDNGGTLTIEGSRINRNITTSGGGGISTSGGTVTVNDSTITNNIAVGAGGGIQAISSGTLTLLTAVINGNLAVGSGGGIFNTSGALNVGDSTVMDNWSGGDGGGIRNGDGPASFSNSTFDGNTATRGGGIFNQAGVLTINGSTISNNTSTGAGGGAGIFSASGLTGNDVTLSGNVASIGPGAGILIAGGTAFLTNGTIVLNTANDGGGLAAVSGGNVTFGNTLVYGNTGGASPDCMSSGGGTLSSNGYNLIGDASGTCTLGGDLTGNLIGADPLIGPLRNNGGRNETHGLGAGSPAVDAGSPVAPGSGGTACGLTDQRGISRPQGTVCDIGSSELATTGVVITKTATPTDDVSAGDTITYTITVTNYTAGPVSMKLRDAFRSGRPELISASAEGFGFAVNTDDIWDKSFSSFAQMMFARDETSWNIILPAGASETITTNYFLIRHGIYENTATASGTWGTTNAATIIAADEAFAVRLSAAAGATPAGTVVPLDTVTGGFISKPDLCNYWHLHGSITINAVGPFADPSPPDGCGWGPIVGIPRVGSFTIPGLPVYANQTTVYPCGDGFVCLDTNGITRSGNPASPDFDASMAGATMADAAPLYISGGSVADVLTFGAFPAGVPPTATDMADRFISAGGGNDTLTCTGPGGCALDAGRGDDALIGGTGPDALLGGPGDDTIEGKAGDDHIVFDAVSTPETDTIVGAAGDGSDTLDFSALPATDSVTVDLQSDVATAVHTNRVVKTSGAGQASFFERVIGGGGDDAFSMGFLPVATRIIDGNFGTDTLTVDAGGGFAVDLPGAAGSGTITGPGGTITYLNIENVVLINVVGPTPVPALSTWALGTLALALAAAVFVFTRRRRELRQTS